MTVDQLRQRLAADNLDFAEFQSNLRDEVTVQRLRQRYVQSSVQISEAEVDQMLATRVIGGPEVRLANIQINLAEGATPDEIAVAKTKIDDDQGDDRPRRDWTSVRGDPLFPGARTRSTAAKSAGARWIRCRRRSRPSCSDEAGPGHRSRARPERLPDRAARGSAPAADAEGHPVQGAGHPGRHLPTRSAPRLRAPKAEALRGSHRRRRRFRQGRQGSVRRRPDPRRRRRHGLVPGGRLGHRRRQPRSSNWRTARCRRCSRATSAST